MKRSIGIIHRFALTTILACGLSGISACRNSVTATSNSAPNLTNTSPNTRPPSNGINGTNGTNGTNGIDGKGTSISTPDGQPIIISREAIPNISFPTSNPYYSQSSIDIKGVCRPGTRVKIIRDATAVEKPCNSPGEFSFSENGIATDGQYTFWISQYDERSKEGESGHATVTWIRSSKVPSTPTIQSPSSLTGFTSAKQITVSGTCEDGSLVTMTLSKVVPDTTIKLDTKSTVCKDQHFSFVVSKTDYTPNLPDGLYQYAITQVSPSQVTSGIAWGTWVINSATFSVEFASRPNAVNIPNGLISNGKSNASFQFKSNYSPVTFQCKLDSETYKDCQANTTLSVSSGAHTLTVKAMSVNADVQESAPISYSWTQQGYPTVALYHFDNEASVTYNSMLDSTKYSRPIDPNSGQLQVTNDLILPDFSMYYSSQVGFGIAPYFTPPGLITPSTYISTINFFTTNGSNSNLNLPNMQMTVEAIVKLVEKPYVNYGTFRVIASKAGDIGDIAWTFGIYQEVPYWKTNSNVGEKLYLYFAWSTDGSTITTKKVLIPVSAQTLGSAFYHTAATFDSVGGKVGLYFGGKRLAVLDVPTTPIWKTSTKASLKIGSPSVNLDAPFGGKSKDLTISGAGFLGYIDEVRLSRIVRYTQDYSVPAKPFQPEE